MMARSAEWEKQARAQRTRNRYVYQAEQAVRQSEGLTMLRCAMVVAVMDDKECSEWLATDPREDDTPPAIISSGSSLGKRLRELAESLERTWATQFRLRRYFHVLAVEKERRLNKQTQKLEIEFYQHWLHRMGFVRVRDAICADRVVAGRGVWGSDEALTRMMTAERNILSHDQTLRIAWMIWCISTAQAAAQHPTEALQRKNENAVSLIESMGHISSIAWRALAAEHIWSCSRRAVLAWSCATETAKAVAEAVVHCGAAGAAEDELQHMKSELEAVRRSTREALQTAEQERMDFQRKCDGLMTEAQQHIEDLEAQLAKAKAVTEDRSKALRDSESQVKVLTEALQDVKVDFDASQKELLRFEEMKNVELLRSEEMKNVQDRHQEEIFGLRDEVAALKDKNEDLERQAVEGADAYVKSKRELEKAKSSLNKFKASHDTLDAALDFEKSKVAAVTLIGRVLNVRMLMSKASCCVFVWFRHSQLGLRKGFDHRKDSAGKELLLRSVLQLTLLEPRSMQLRGMIRRWLMRSTLAILAIKTQKAIITAKKPLQEEIGDLKEERKWSSATLRTYELSRQIVWEYRKHSNADPRLCAWQQLPPMLSKACEEALANRQEVVKGDHTVDGKRISLVMMINQRKAIRIDTGKQTELRRRNPTMKFETLATGMKVPPVNYLGFQTTKGQTMDSQAVLTALAVSTVPEERPPKLIQALEDLFHRDLKIDIPAFDPACHLDAAEGA